MFISIALIKKEKSDKMIQDRMEFILVKMVRNPYDFIELLMLYNGTWEEHNGYTPEYLQNLKINKYKILEEDEIIDRLLKRKVGGKSFREIKGSYFAFEPMIFSRQEILKDNQKIVEKPIRYGEILNGRLSFKRVTALLISGESTGYVPIEKTIYF